MKTIILVASAAALAGAVAHAAGVPATLTHHGYLTDDRGAAITRDVPMTFRLFDLPASGVELWSEEVANVPVADGFYAVTLGLKASLAPVAAAHADLYLEIAVDGSVMLPRQRIGAVPFALVAGDAVGDIHPSSVSIGSRQVIDADGKWVGEPVAGGGVSRVETQAPLTGGPITAAGTLGIQKATALQDGYLAKEDFAAFNGKQGAVKNACDAGTYAVALQVDGTLVCVAAAGGGTVTEVRTGTGLTGGPVRADGEISLDQAYVDGRYINAAGDTVNGQINFLLNGGNGGLTVGLDQLVCTPGGNVGVGTGSPQSRLHVAGDIRANGEVRAATVSFGNGSTLGGDANGSIELGVSTQSGTTPFIDFHYGKGAVEDYNARVINDADGQLTVLASTLHVAGNVSVDGQIRSSGGPAVYACPLYNDGGCPSYCTGSLSTSSTCSYWTWSSGCSNWGFTQACTLVGRLVAP